jgi:uncharacterized protein with FMN-binding domain
MSPIWGFLLSFIGVSLGLYKGTEAHLRHVHDLTIPSINASQLPDSTYHGSYWYFFYSYKIAATVKEHRIAEIKIIKNRNDKWARMAEGVIPRVIEAQRTDVDAVSGATTTSKALLMAVYNALAPAKKVSSP